MNVRSMRPDGLDAAVGVWREANIVRGAPHGPERTARIREKLSASDALPFVALRPGIVGMALAEPGRLDDGAGELDASLLHISMVFVRPAAQRTGVGLPLVRHALDGLSAGRSLDGSGEPPRSQALRASRDDPHRQDRSPPVEPGPAVRKLDRRAARVMAFWPIATEAGTDPRGGRRSAAQGHGRSGRVLAKAGLPGQRTRSSSSPRRPGGDCRASVPRGSRQ